MLVLDDDELEALAQLLDGDFESWRGQLTPAELCDLRYYQASGFWHINRYLRRLYDVEPSEGTLRQVSSAISNIDAALRRIALVRSLTVYRGVVDGPRTLGMPLEDATPTAHFADQAYLSTSLDLRAAKSKAADTQTSLILQIDVPLGQSAGWFGLLGKNIYRSEYEVLLPRQVRMEVVDLGQCGSVPMLHVKVVTDHE